MYKYIQIFNDVILRLYNVIHTNYILCLSILIKYDSQYIITHEKCIYIVFIYVIYIYLLCIFLCSKDVELNKIVFTTLYL